MSFKGNKQEIRKLVIMFVYAGASDLSRLSHGHAIPSEKGVYDSFTLRIFCFRRDDVLRLLLPASVYLICL